MQYDYLIVKDWVQSLALLEKSDIGPGQAMVHKTSRDMIARLHADLIDAKEKLDFLQTVMDMGPYEIDNVRSDSNV